MTIYPAVYIKNGCAVKLRHGRIEEMTDYGDPMMAAVRWQEQGAEVIHVVDLDGAFDGGNANLDVIRVMVRSVDIPIQLGGGIRSLGDIEIRLHEIGVDRVILGTLATSDPELVREACERWPGRIVLGWDINGNSLMVRGWRAQSAISPEELLHDMALAGIDTIVFTDVARDGQMEGPNMDVTTDIVAKTPMKVIGAGGIGSLEDIRMLKQAGCEGVILGRALYDGRIKLREALAIA